MMTTGTQPSAGPLDLPVAHSLTGRHRHLARWRGHAMTYRPDTTTFCALPAEPFGSDWSDLAALLGRGALADLFSHPASPPEAWEQVFGMAGLQLVAPATIVAERADIEHGGRLVALGAKDVEDMLALARQTGPGPFWRATVRLGPYLGIREGGRLVAMAGIRLRPPGWSEISAVCTAPHVRGRGYASLLVRVLGARLAHAGDRVFLHVAGSNTSALSLYRRLGFQVRREVTFHGYRVP